MLIIRYLWITKLASNFKKWHKKVKSHLLLTQRIDILFFPILSKKYSEYIITSIHYI